MEGPVEIDLLDILLGRAIVGVPGMGINESAPESLKADSGQAIAMVVVTIRKQGLKDWGKAYIAERESEAKDRFQIFVRCAGHAHHHVGPLKYLGHELART